MTAVDDLITVLELALPTEDRSDSEQAAMLRVAERAQRQANALVVTNERRGPAVRIYEHVATTRDPASGPSLRNDLVAQKLKRQADRWDRWHP